MVKKITLYIATSSDGFIATKEGSISWLDKFNELGEDYGYVEFIKNIDIVVMGKTTYEQILSFDCEYPYKDQKGYVFSDKKGSDENVTFVQGDVKEFSDNLEGNIWVVGGANIVNQFLEYNLIDEFIIFVMPVQLNEGIKLFEEDNYEKNLILENKKEFPSGVVEYHYKKK